MLNNNNQPPQYQNINYNPYGVPAMPNFNNGNMPVNQQLPQNSNIQTSQDANNFNNLLQNLQSKIMGSGSNGNQLIEQIQGLLNGGNTAPALAAAAGALAGGDANKDNAPLTKESLLGLLGGMLNKQTSNDPKEVEKKLLEIYSTKAMESLIKNGKSVDAKAIAKNSFDIAQSMIEEFKNRSEGKTENLQMTPEAQNHIIENV